VSFVSRPFEITLGLVALALLSGDAGAEPLKLRRHVPARLIKAVEGCWQPWPGEMITIRRSGTDGLATKSRFVPRAGETTIPGDDVNVGQRWRPAWYVAEVDGLDIGCGRPSQHGQVCLVRLVDGKVEFQFWAYTYQRTKHLTRTAFADRCAPERRPPAQ